MTIPHSTLTDSALVVDNPPQKKLSNSSTAHFTSEELAKWNTSIRLLASLVSDQMIGKTAVANPFDSSQIGLLLHGKSESSKSPSSPAIWIGLSDAGKRFTKAEFANSATFPGDFAPPISVTAYSRDLEVTKSELNPASLLKHVQSALDSEPYTEEVFDTICEELENSAENGQYWIEWYKTQKPLSFKSSFIQWEQSLYSGHPLHPMHRSFRAEAPVAKLNGKEITSLMNHSISLISVPGSEVRISGPLRQVLAPLLEQFGLENNQPGMLIMPCVTMQIPAIKQFHPEIKVLIENAWTFDTQSSLRTVSIPFFDYDLKFSMDVIMSSALRTISSRTVTILSELTMILKEVLPENLWLMADAGGVAGYQEDFDESKHISCVFRENLNRRARANNETIVLTGALQEIPPGSDECNAAILYNLKTEQEKMTWFAEFTEGMIEAFVGPTLDYGIAFECHAQNALMRMDRATGKIKGWATRDLGSIKVHLPTLAKSGYELFQTLKESRILTDSEVATWRIIQFCLIENHLNIFIYRLGVSRPAAWRMIREKLEAFIETRKHLECIERFRAFMFAKEIPLKAFMRMKFSKKARMYEYVDVPNVLLEGMDEEEDALLEVKTKKVHANGVVNGYMNGTNGAVTNGGGNNEE